MNRETDVFPVVAELIEAYLRSLRRTVRKRLTRLTGAFLRLSAASGTGKATWACAACTSRCAGRNADRAS